MTTASVLSGGVPAARAPRSLTLISVAGVNALEAFDFLCFAFFATQIGANFFPAKTQVLSTIAALATFGAGFLTRPLGALVLGRMGDRMGRRPTLLLNATLMGLASAALAVTPAYDRIGLASPLLALASRLVQGFALGGEIGASTAFFAEVARGRRSGPLISLQNGGQELATVFAGLTGLSLSTALDPAALAEWGWRVPFVIGAGLVPLLLVLRLTLSETLHHERAAVAHPAAPGRIIRIGLIGAAAMGCTSVGTYTMNYLTTYAIGTLHLPARIAFETAVVLGCTGVCAAGLAGFFGDRLAAGALLVRSWLAMTVIAVPVYAVIAAVQSPVSLLMAAALLKLPLAIASTLVVITITRALPAAQRCTALGLSYALGVSLLGGSTQFVIATLIAVTGNPLAPAFYLLGIGLIGCVAMRYVAAELASQVRRAI